MKKWIIICLLFLPTLQVLAQETIVQQRVTIAFESVTLEEALNQLSVEAGTPISFNTRLNGMTDEVTAQFDNATVGEVLNSLLKDKNLDFKVLAGQITILKKINITNNYHFDNKNTHYIIDV